MCVHLVNYKTARKNDAVRIQYAIEHHVSRILVFLVSNRSNTNRAGQPQEMVRGLKIRIKE